MGCGASRDAPVSATLSFIPRVEKERDDFSIADVHLKRLGVGDYDDFFTDFETAVNVVVALNNGLFDSLCDVKTALAYAASPDPEYALDLEVISDGVLSGPQVLLDVLYAENGSRPQPFEVRHLLASRPAIAEADRILGAAVQDLSLVLRSLSSVAHIRLAYDEAKRQLVVGGPGAAAVQPLLPRVNAALETFRKVAPGIRIQVTVVQTPAPGAGTFAWRLVPLSSGRVQGAAGTKEQDDEAAVDMASARPTATPLRVACAHGSAAIVEAAMTVAQQAAALASAMAAATAAATAAANAAAVAAASPSTASAAAGYSVAAAAANVSQLQISGGRRLDAVPDVTQASTIAATAVAAAAAAVVPVGLGRSSMAALRTLSLTRRAGPDATASDAPPAGGAATTASGGINAAATVDDATAALRRAVTSANHAIFRLAKYASAGASSGPEGTALRSREGSGSAVPSALKLVMQAAIQAARHAASAATGGAGGGSGAHLAATDLLSADPRVNVASENGSAISGSTLSGAANSSAYTSLLAREVGTEGLTPGWSWSWEWGIEPRVIGVEFPECLAPRARAVYDAINVAVSAAQAATDQLPLVQREVSTMVEESEAVFEKNDAKLVAAGKDMMTAARLRAALDRNANTISASPGLVNLLQASVAKLIDDLKRGAEEMQALMYGDPGGGVAGGRRRSSSSDPWDTGRPSGGRSKMARQLQSAAAAAAAAVAAAVGSRRASAVASAGDPSSGAPAKREAKREGGGDGAGGGEGDGYSAQSSSVRDRDSAGTALRNSISMVGAGVTPVGAGAGAGAGGDGPETLSAPLPGQTAGSGGEAPRGGDAASGGGGGTGPLSLPPTGKTRGGGGAGKGVSRRVMLPPLASSGDSDATWDRFGSSGDGHQPPEPTRLPLLPNRKLSAAGGL